MTFPSLQYRLSSFFLHWQHRFERWSEHRVYPDEGALRFQLPKDLDSRDALGRQSGRRLAEALSKRLNEAQELYNHRLERKSKRIAI